MPLELRVPTRIRSRPQFRSRDLEWLRYFQVMKFERGPGVPVRDYKAPTQRRDLRYR